jgi:hypothetical protein
MSNSRTRPEFAVFLSLCADSHGPQLIPLALGTFGEVLVTIETTYKFRPTYLANFEKSRQGALSSGGLSL